MDANLKSLASLIRATVFRNEEPVWVQEVEEGLLRMMENEGFAMWPVILNHCSLVPIVNRLDFQIRIHNRLVDEVARIDVYAYLDVLALVEFPRG
jgi:hypothetical protein